jgi:hypothetical protein
LSYARMVGREQCPEVAALAGAIARLYDDLIRTYGCAGRLNLGLTWENAAERRPKKYHL